MANDQLQDRNKKFKDEGTDKRIHEILSNENTTVSEQDISNIITDSAITEHDSAKDPENKAQKKAGDKKIRDDDDPEIDNDSWNILEGET